MRLFHLVVMASTLLLLSTRSNGYAVPRLQQNCVRLRLQLQAVPKNEAMAIVSSCATMGDVCRIRIAGETSYLGAKNVPTFKCSGGNLGHDDEPTAYRSLESKLKDHGPAFCVDSVLSVSACRDIISACESVGFESFQCGKNNHGAMQLIVSQAMVDVTAQRIAPYIDMHQLDARRQEMHSLMDDNHNGKEVPLIFAGLNRRWRVYKYAPDAYQSFAPHIDAGFPPSGLTEDETEMVYDVLEPADDKIVSRLSVLFYLNDDFTGGETNFYRPLSVASECFGDWEECRIASVRPITGSCLVFPQCVGEGMVDYAREHWPLHEGSPVRTGSPKYVIRSDILFAEVLSNPATAPNNPLYRLDRLVRKK